MKKVENSWQRVKRESENSRSGLCLGMEVGSVEAVNLGPSRFVLLSAGAAETGRMRGTCGSDGNPLGATGGGAPTPCGVVQQTRRILQ
jgi:hypothetical protein